MLSPTVAKRFDPTSGPRAGLGYYSYEARSPGGHAQVELWGLQAAALWGPNYRDAITMLGAVQRAAHCALRQLLDVIEDPMRGEVWLVWEAASRSDARLTGLTMLPWVDRLSEAIETLHRHGGWHGRLTPHDLYWRAGEPVWSGCGVWPWSNSELAGPMWKPLAPWLAPEVRRGERPDAAADIYGFGAIVTDWWSQVSGRPRGAMRVALASLTHVHKWNRPAEFGELREVLGDLARESLAEDYDGEGATRASPARRVRARGSVHPDPDAALIRSATPAALVSSHTDAARVSREPSTARGLPAPLPPHEPVRASLPPHSMPQPAAVHIPAVGPFQVPIHPLPQTAPGTGARTNRQVIISLLLCAALGLGLGWFFAV